MKIGVEMVCFEMNDLFKAFSSTLLCIKFQALK